MLHIAALGAASHMADLVHLLDLGQQVNVCNGLYQTPLHLAVLTANIEAVATLLSLGASLSAQDSNGNTPLHAACLSNDICTLKTLCDFKWNHGMVAGHAETDNDVTEDRKEGKGLELKTALCVRNSEGFTAIHLAVLHRRLELTTCLLHFGADVNAKDGKSGRSALHLAVDMAVPCPDIVSTLLLQPSLDINAVNFAQQTALQLARGRHHWRLVQLLHDHGALWPEAVHRQYSGDNEFDEDDTEDENHWAPYDDLCLAGLQIYRTQCA